MASLAFVPVLLCSWMIWFAAKPIASTTVFEQTRYVNETNSTFLISGTTELSCTCQGKHGEINTNETYYRVFVDDIRNISFSRTKPSNDFCNSNITFYAYKERNRRFTMEATCYSIVSTYEQFSAVQLVFSTFGFDWSDTDGGFDLNGHHVDPRTPCSNCGDNCPCSAGKMVYDIGMRGCCQPGVPRPRQTSGFAVKKTDLPLLLTSLLFITFYV